MKRLLSASLLTILLCVTTQAFAAEGLASWYTRESTLAEGNSGICANGEAMRNSALTCAMRSRHFGRRYKVTNLENGKSVIVRQTDFGPGRRPAARGRVIDLTKAAFSRIANLKTGVVRVKVEVVR